MLGQEKGLKEILLQIDNLRIVFDTYQGQVYALSGVNLALLEKRITGLVGETGCGKSVTAKAILRLLPPNARVVGGQIWFRGEDLLQKTEREMERIRGEKIAMVFQSPRASLNPVFTIEQQLGFVVRRHLGLKGKQARAYCLELLKMVGIGDPVRRLKNYPFELSTGMCQRVMIGMAISCKPSLLIADEATTALDVTIQAQILALLTHLVQEIGLTTMIITHDLGVVSETCDYVAVMYAGQIIEFGSVNEVLGNPLHPYTRGLLRSSFINGDKHKFYYLTGAVPTLYNPPKGCVFMPRCPEREDCPSEDPPTIVTESGHLVRCWLLKDENFS